MNIKLPDEHYKISIISKAVQDWFQAEDQS